VDGAETVTKKDAQATETAQGIAFRYAETDGVSVLRFHNGYAEIERAGGYGMRLTLKEGERSVGALSLGGQDGELLAFTHKISYSKTQNRFFALLKYDLLFGEEKQEMRVRVQADFSTEKGVTV
jgi:hypothetical protein